MFQSTYSLTQGLKWALLEVQLQGVAMAGFGSEIASLTYAGAMACALALAWAYRHCRETSFLILVISAVVMALGNRKRGGGDVCLEIEGFGRVTIQMAGRRGPKEQQP
jgi:hypothetical protein